MLSALASQSTVDHPLVNEKPNPSRAAILVITSDRGLAGGYSSNAIKAGEALANLVRSEGKEPVNYLVGRKSVAFFRFRNRAIEQSWTGFSEKPKYENAKEVADTLIEAFVKPTEEGGVDEIHIVFTEYVSALTQAPKAVRVLPLVVEYSEEQAPDGPLPLYEFEPEAESLLDALLPRYVETRVFAALLASAASESAATAPGDEGRDGQRRGPHQVAHPSGERGPSGRDHPRDQRDRRRRKRARLIRE